MRKSRLFVIALGVFLAVSGYAQTNENETDERNAGFFFGAGISSGIFTSNSLKVYSDYEILELNPVKIGAYYELPMGSGNLFVGLEGGFASGSNFGGGGGIDFLPINLNLTYAFGIADILYIGPSLKAGALGLLSHAKYNMLPLLGAALDFELRYRYFPLGIYAQGGVNAYPTTNGFNILPTVEAGIRFPRGAAFGSSGQSTRQSNRSAQSDRTSTGSGLTPGQGAGAAASGAASPGAASPGATS
ncbi:MAG: hypothetical protein LBQ94_12660, partial [Treponema sp.]|nr:hypothetical protein [Treponema sp.]